MKKLIVMIVAVMMMAFSSVSALAVSVKSPVATKAPEQKTVTTVKNADTSSSSPKTGSGDMLAYTLIAASVIGCGAASAALVKLTKKN